MTLQLPPTDEQQCQGLGRNRNQKVPSLQKDIGTFLFLEKVRNMIEQNFNQQAALTIPALFQGGVMPSNERMLSATRSV